MVKSPPKASAWPNTLTLTGSDVERPGIPGQLHRARNGLQRSLVVPAVVTAPRRQPSPSEHLLDGDRRVSRRRRPPAEERRRRSSPFGEREREAVQQEIRRRERPAGGARPPQPGNVAKAARGSQARRRTGRRTRRRDSLSGKLGGRAARGACAAWRSSPGASLPRLSAKEASASQQIQATALEFVERSGLRHRQEAPARGRRPRPRRPGPPRALCPLAARDRRSARPRVQERGRGREPAARLSPARRELQLARDLLVRPGGCRSQMPRTTIRVDLATVTSANARCRPALRPARQTGTRPSAPGDGGRSRAPRGPASPSVASTAAERDPEVFACALQQQRIADRLGRGDEQQTTRVLGEASSRRM